MNEKPANRVPPPIDTSDKLAFSSPDGTLLSPSMLIPGVDMLPASSWMGGKSPAEGAPASPDSRPKTSRSSREALVAVRSKLAEATRMCGDPPVAVVVSEAEAEESPSDNGGKKSLNEDETAFMGRYDGLPSDKQREFVIALMRAAAVALSNTEEDDEYDATEVMRVGFSVYDFDPKSNGNTPKASSFVPHAGHFGNSPGETSLNISQGGMGSRMQSQYTAALSERSVIRPSTAHTRRAEKVVDDTGIETLNQYMLMEELGSGAQGRVMLALDTDCDESRAIKIIPRPKGFAGAANRLLSGRQNALRLKREIAIMKKMSHRNVIRLYEVIDDPESNKLYLVLQFAEHGPLVKLNSKEMRCEPIPIETFTPMARQICAGLAYIHSHGVVHRDIKPDNILRGSDGQVFLADFGVSEVFGFDEENADDMVWRAESNLAARHMSIQGMIGTKVFLPPEVLRANTCLSEPSFGVMSEPSNSPGPLSLESSRATSSSIDGFAADVWALGVSFYTFLTGCIPFVSGPATPSAGSEGKNLEGDAAIIAIIKNELEFPAGTTVPNVWQDLLRKMLCKDPNGRPSVRDVKKRIKEYIRSCTVEPIKVDLPTVPSIFVQPGTARNAGTSSNSHEDPSGSFLSRESSEIQERSTRSVLSTRETGSSKHSNLFAAVTAKHQSFVLDGVPDVTEGDMEGAISGIAPPKTKRQNRPPRRPMPTARPSIPQPSTPSDPLETRFQRAPGGMGATYPPDEIMAAASPPRTAEVGVQVELPILPPTRLRGESVMGNAEGPLERAGTEAYNNSTGSFSSFANTTFSPTATIPELANTGAFQRPKTSDTDTTVRGNISPDEEPQRRHSSSDSIPARRRSTDEFAYPSPPTVRRGTEEFTGTPH